MTSSVEFARLREDRGIVPGLNDGILLRGGVGLRAKERERLARPAAGHVGWAVERLFLPFLQYQWPRRIGRNLLV